MQTPTFNIKLLHNFISKQLKANMKKTNRPKLDFLSLVRKHNELTNEQKTAPIVSPSNISSFIANRGLSKQINQKLKSQTLAELDLSRYKILNEIGSGAYSTIYLTEEVDTNLQFALKKLIIDEVDMVSQIKNEIELVKYLSKKDVNIIPFHNFCINKLDATTHVIYLLMPLAEGDFSSQIMKIKSQRNFSLLNVFIELIKTCAIMQRENICHRDIKPQNILYLDENSMIEAQKFCLCDFDEVIRFKERCSSQMRLEVKGTQMFMSPILYQAFRTGEHLVVHNPFKSDAYSLGLCFVYAIAKTYDVIMNIREKDDDENKKFLKQYIDGQEINEDIVDLVMLMIAKEEKDRMDFIQLDEYINRLNYSN